MNVRAGDLAYLVKCPEAGRTVEVLHYVGYVDGYLTQGPCWFVRSRSPIDCALATGGIAPRVEFAVPDALLRPISGERILEDEVRTLTREA